jgi:hypothetical protein
MTVMLSSIIFLVLVMCRPSIAFAHPLFPINQQAKNPAHANIGQPRPDRDLTAGNWKYRVTVAQPDGNYVLTYAITIKDDGAVWTVSTLWGTPDGTVTDVSTLERGTLILRKEVFKHFAKPGREWPIATTLVLTGSKATGTTTMNGQDQPVAVDLGGPVFADAAGTNITIGCLPLADGYSTTFRNWNIQLLKERLVQLRVVATERVTVAAGTFDCYRVELTSAAGGPDRETIWIAKDTRTPVKSSGVENSGRTTTTAELVGKESSNSPLLNTAAYHPHSLLKLPQKMIGFHCSRCNTQSPSTSSL